MLQVLKNSKPKHIAENQHFESVNVGKSTRHGRFSNQEAMQQTSPDGNHPRSLDRGEHDAAIRRSPRDAKRTPPLLLASESWDLVAG